MKRKYIDKILLFGSFIYFLLGFCSSFGQELEIIDNKTAIQEIGIIVEKTTEGEITICRYCKSIVQGWKIHSDGQHIIENHIRNYLLSKKIIPKECIEKEDKCIYVLLYRFEEKIGGDYSVEKPSKVGFHMHFMDKTIPVRYYNFYEEQTPLLTNLFGIGKFLKRKAKWIDATTLAEEGVKKALDTMIGGQ